jgi:hypothetical protein
LFDIGPTYFCICSIPQMGRWSGWIPNFRCYTFQMGWHHRYWLGLGKASQPWGRLGFGDRGMFIQTPSTSQVAQCVHVCPN